MLVIEDGFSSSLNRLNFVFLHEMVVTECIKDYGVLSLFGENFGPFEVGKKYKLPLFSAIPFIEKGILQVALIDKCDNIDVQRYAIEERDDSMLIKRSNKYFLNKIREFRRFMENEIIKKHKPKIDIDRYQSYTFNIINSRLLKILKLSMAELSLDDERRLTISEKVLYENLYKLIKIWRNFFQFDFV
ncbi:MAG: hypothetical protein ACFFA4_01995 [Promethearchaeota archaeon]